MNSPFSLHELNNRTWGVAWSKVDVTFTNHMRFNLIDFVFKNIKCFEFGLFISDGDNLEGDIMWINQRVFFQEITDEYSRYLYSNYKIIGSVFHKKNEAELFKELLEKRYAWHLLKE